MKERFENIDLALIECGQYGKGWPSVHMFPEEVQMVGKPEISPVLTDKSFAEMRFIRV